MNNGAVSALRQPPKGATKAAKTENRRPLIRSQTSAPHISSEPALSRSRLMSACRNAYTKYAQTLSLGNPYSNPSRSLIPATVTAAPMDPIKQYSKSQ